MHDLKRYWQEVRAIERTLAASVWLVSLDSGAREAVGGRIAEVPAAAAAKLLHGKSHRLATQEEIGAENARQEALKRQVEKDSLRRRGIAIVEA